MESKNKLKETVIKNRMCYYFDDVINGTKISFSNVLLDKELYENTLVYKISYKTPTDPNRVLGSTKQMALLYLLIEKLNV